jgi:hypothetical protein
MTTNSAFDRRAAAWLADGPTELNDRVLDAALREVHLTAQRRRWSAPWRTSLMPLRLGATALAATLLLAALIGFNLVGSGGSPTGPTTAPTPAGTVDVCGHVLGDGLVLTAGCAYRTEFSGPTLSIVGDGTWYELSHGTDAYAFEVFTGPAINTTLRIQMVRAVREDPCDPGSTLASPAPGTARAYVDWLGGYVPEASHATPADALGFRGWQVDIAAPTATASQVSARPCDPIELASAPESAADAGWLYLRFGGARRVLVLDTPQGVLLAALDVTRAAESLPAGEAFLAGISAAP